MSAQARLKRLEELLLEQKAAGCLSVEALLDLLLCFYTEVSHSPLKREKHVTDFLEWGRSQARGLCQNQNRVSVKSSTIEAGP